MTVATRRDFLAASAAVLASLGIAPARLRALPMGAHARRLPPMTWFPEPPADAQLQTLALAAMDAARVAGAEYADIRIGIQRMVSVPVLPYSPGGSFTLGYGVRARVRGAWSFVAGNIMTLDAVTTVARSAASGAHAYAAVNARLRSRHETAMDTADLAPAPAVQGEWHVPMQIDPFTVPLDDYYRTIGMLAGPSGRAYDSATVGCAGLGWRAERRVFASTAGALVTQSVVHGGPSASAFANLPGGGHQIVSRAVPGLETPAMGGFEVVLDPTIPDRMRAALDDVARWAELPMADFQDVGRYPIVFCGAAWASVIGQTVSRALDGDMVAGLERDTSGTTFLRPALDILTAPTPLLSPLLTLDAHRALPSMTAVGWDDDGVAPEPYTLVDHGRVTAYHTTQETAPLFAAWDRQQRRPVRSHGSAVATTPSSVPVGGFAHVTMRPAVQRATLDDLLRDMRRGFAVVRGDAADQPSFSSARVSGTVIVDVRNGRPVAGVKLEAYLLTKLALGSKLIAVGDASTVETTLVGADKGIPWQSVVAPVTAPAVLCADLAVRGRR